MVIGVYGIFRPHLAPQNVRWRGWRSPHWHSCWTEYRNRSARRPEGKWSFKLAVNDLIWAALDDCIAAAASVRCSAKLRCWLSAAQARLTMPSARTTVQWLLRPITDLEVTQRALCLGSPVAASVNFQWDQKLSVSVRVFAMDCVLRRN